MFIFIDRKFVEYFLVNFAFSIIFINTFVLNSFSALFEVKLISQSPFYAQF